MQTEPVRKLLAHDFRAGLLVGDLILLELLQGARTTQDAIRIERRLRSFPIVTMLNPDLAVEAATNYRHLRAWGSQSVSCPT